MNSPLPRIAITMGDPAGVGPELCLRLLDDPQIAAVAVPIVFGDADVLRQAADQCHLPWETPVVEAGDSGRLLVEIRRPSIYHLAHLKLAEFHPTRVDANTGSAALTYITAAIQAALAGQVAAMVTAPIHKEALHLAGLCHPGHTEILADQTQASDYCMMLTAPEITCSFVTAHVGLRDVAALLTTDSIVRVIRLSGRAIRQWRGREPQLVVCGLNPHAGEHGLFGAGEEERIIEPAVEIARQEGWHVTGPMPPDTAFLPAIRQQTDCYICMYHDQGLIPLKALAFDDAVNVTLGLPIVRTSVDHGTALDIAWTGQASVASLVKATQLAVRLVQ